MHVFAKPGSKLVLCKFFRLGIVNLWLVGWIQGALVAFGSREPLLVPCYSKALAHATLQLDGEEKQQQWLGPTVGSAWT